MTTTTLPTRQDVLDALLAERIGRLPETVRVSVEGCLDVAALDEADATGKDYDDAYDEMIEHYEAGQEILRDWRLVQSETFDPTVSLETVLGHQQLVLNRGAVMPLIAVYVGYIPVDACMRYVGLAPRQEEES